MTDLRLPLPPGIDHAPMRALARAVEAELLAIDAAMPRLRVTDIETVDASLLLHLAWQWHVEGVYGWDLAETNRQRRDLILSAWDLWAHAGTPYAITRALAALGWQARVIEGADAVRHDGLYRRDGSVRHGGGDRWALFSVAIDPADRPITGGTGRRVVGLIDAWRNARSQLMDLRWAVTVSEAAPAPVDVLAGWPIAVHLVDRRPWLAVHDGSLARGGTAARTRVEAVHAAATLAIAEPVGVPARHDAALSDRAGSVARGGMRRLLVDAPPHAEIIWYRRHDGMHRRGADIRRHDGTVRRDGSGRRGAVSIRHGGDIVTREVWAA